MSNRFSEFARIVEARCGIAEGRLLDALFIIRAHYSLAAIAECCMRLTTLYDAFPELAGEPASADQQDRLDVLRRIGELREIDPHFAEGATQGARRGSGKREAEPTPLRPYTGESGLCELLLLKPGRQAGDDESLDGSTRANRHTQDFDRLKAWFAWQTFHHQALRHSRADYERYLKGGGTELLKLGAGSRIYGASLFIRKLGDSRWADAAGQVAGLVSSFAETRSIELIHVIEGALASVRRLPRSRPLDDESHVREYQREVAVVRALETVGADGARPTSALDPASLARFLRYVWVGERTAHRHGARVGQFHGSGGVHLDVRRYRDSLTVSYPVDEDEEKAGQVVEIHALLEQEGNAPVRGMSFTPEVVSPDDVLDDPVEEPPVEPQVKIYLGEGDPIAAWFAGKAEAHHIERANALLPWPKSRLSMAAIHAVAALVRFEAADTIVDRRARLTIGLSLITGRPFGAVATPLLLAEPAHVDQDVATKDRIRVTLQDHLLHVPAARPDLKQFKWSSDPFPTYCAPWSATLRLPMPNAWWPLVDRLQDVSTRTNRRVATRARALVAALPEELAVTPKGVAGALRLAVLEAGHGDLGLVKALTDADDANLQNLIHYASYPRSEVEALWRQIVEGWLGPLEPAPAIIVSGERVGSPFGIEIDKVAARVSDLKARFHSAVAEHRWRAVYNQLAMYLSIWLGLATAGRRTCDPVPGVITQDGWALIRDKSRPDESTDRYVPLTGSLRRQIEVVRAFSDVLALADPEFALPAPGSEHLLELRVFLPPPPDVTAGPGTDKPTRHRRLPQTSRPFQPKYLDRTTVLRDLPGNWGRKLARSSSPELPGRFKDTGLGHWVRGRHPWSTTSTFPSAEFKRQWLALQSRLEHANGFELLGADGEGESVFGTAIRPVWYPLPAKLGYRERRGDNAQPEADGETDAAASPPTGASAIGASAPDAGPMNSDPLDERQTKKPAADASASGAPLRTGKAIRLARLRRFWAKAAPAADPPALTDDEFQALVRRCDGMDLCRRVFDGRQGEDALQLATDVVGANVGRSAEDTQMLAKRVCAYIRTRTSIPLFAMKPRARFQRNWMVNRYEFGSLAYVEQTILPAVEKDLGHLPSRRDGLKEQRIAVGRLLVAAAWRGGLLSVDHLDAFLCALGRNERVVAIGNLRLIELPAVRSRRTADPMRRTILLEPYLAALVTVERNSLAAALGSADSQHRRQRRARWNAALRAYLQSVGVPAEIPLATLLAALRQRIQLNASPVIAAYASGELLTHDLPTAEFCRLAGFDKPKLRDGSDPPITKTREPSAARPDDPEEQSLPADLRKHSFAARIAGLESESITVWREQIRRARASASTPTQELFCGFASSLLNEYYAAGRRRGLGKRQRKTISTNFVIVWNGLARLESAGTLQNTLDEDTLQALREATEDFYSARRHHGAWDAFRKFLAEDRPHPGFTIASIKTASPSVVSAKMLSGSEQGRIGELLGSVLSGIGTAEYRDVAQRHFALTRSIGARRAETEKLRWVDVDGDMLRIRPYPGRTLKSEASERAVPLRLVERREWEALTAIEQVPTGQVIDAIPGRLATGDNFFDAASKAMKVAAADADIGPHHLRHTLASAFTLGLLGNAVDLGRLQDDLPWVAGALPGQEQLGVLLGSEGQCGQGLKAVSALLGHLHETTTLKHYVHILCIALYAHLLGLPDIPLQVAFEKRIGSRATLHRRAKACRDRGSSDTDVARALRDELESLAETEWKNTGDQEPNLIPLVVFATPRVAVAASDGPHRTAETRGGRASEIMSQFEAAHRYFAEGAGIEPDNVEGLRSALLEIAAIPTGKRGAAIPRHPMPGRGKDGTPLPAMVAAKSAAWHAKRLIAWLVWHEHENPDGHRWLLEKWLYTSDAREGSMRLDGPDEVTRAKGLNVRSEVALDVSEVRVSAKRKRTGQKPNFRARIRFPKNAQVEDQNAKKFGQRQAGAVRWVLTWAAAYRLARNGQARVPAGEGPDALGHDPIRQQAERRQADG